MSPITDYTVERFKPDTFRRSQNVSQDQGGHMQFFKMLVLVVTVVGSALGEDSYRVTVGSTPAQIEYPAVALPGNESMAIAVVKLKKESGWPLAVAFADAKMALEVGNTAVMEVSQFVKTASLKDGASTVDVMWTKKISSTTATPEKKQSKALVGGWKIAGKVLLRVEIPPFKREGYSLVRLGNGNYGVHQQAVCFGNPPKLGDLVEVTNLEILLGAQEEGVSWMTHVQVNVAICGKIVKGKADRDTRVLKSNDALSVRFVPESELGEQKK